MAGRAVVCALTVGIVLFGGLAKARLSATPTLGFSTWNMFPFKGVTADVCYRQAQALVDTGLRDVGYSVFVVDEPCFLGRHSDGTLMENTTAWPQGGLKEFAKFLRARGMTLGIYTDAGKETCQGCPGSLGHEVQDMQTFRSWGAMYVKIDRCFAVDSPEVRWGLPDTFAMYRDAAPDVQLSMILAGTDNCWSWGNSTAGSCRTTQDIHYSYQSMYSNVENQERVPGIASFAGRGFQNDLDMLMIGTVSPATALPALSLPESRTQMAVWAVLKSPLLISANVSALNSDQLAVLANPDILAVSQDSLVAQAERLWWSAKMPDDSLLRLSLQACIAEEGASKLPAQQWQRTNDGLIVRSGDNDMCLSVPSCSTKPGAGLVLCNCTDPLHSANAACHNQTCSTQAQVWKLDDQQRLRNVFSDLCLQGLLGPGPSSVVQSICSDNALQRWNINAHNQSITTIRPTHGGSLCLSSEVRPSTTATADVFVGRLSGGRMVVAVANKQTNSQTVVLPFAALAWPSDCAQVRDVWLQRSLGVVSNGSLVVQVATHDTGLITLGPCKRNLDNGASSQRELAPASWRAVLTYPFMSSATPACNSTDKQKALYLEYEFSPPLKTKPATDITVAVNWTSVNAMRQYGANGVFAAHPFSTEGDGPGGYFGSQADGNASKGGLVFSVWDAVRRPPLNPAECKDQGWPNATWCQHLHSFPLSPECHRHCLDCGLHPGWHNTTGTQCSLNHSLQEGDQLRFRLFRSARNRSLTYQGHTYHGAEWTLTARLNGGPTKHVGVMLLQEAYGGVDRFGAFHEHIGCTPCSAFYESEVRSGPWLSDGRNVSIAFRRKTVPCELYDVHLLGSRVALVETGPGTGPNHTLAT
eukprot:m.6401 g.6401  ORF g.6401 m.6401 type:complete len:868 (-) comp2629_c0_seq1:146-2749(-)